jgi:serine/threonine protein kinase
VGLRDFELLAVIGRGGYGKVCQVRRIRRVVDLPLPPGGLDVAVAHVEELNRSSGGGGGGSSGGGGHFFLSRRQRRDSRAAPPDAPSGQDAADPAVPDDLALMYAEPPPRDEGRVYALKVLRKRDLIARRQVARTLTERRILTDVRHPFIVGLRYAFTTASKLYMVLDFARGGDFFTLLSRYGAVGEDRAVLYVAELVLALEYLHARGVVYRCVGPA